MNCKYYEKPPYASREERSRFSYLEYKKYFGESVLDVGGYRGGLSKIFSGRYLNIDMDEGADFVLNLDKVDKLPIEDKVFDTVVCTDVLEHLENIHLIFDEICRVSKKSVIISMPNGWNNIRYIVGGMKSQFSKIRPRRLLDRHWVLPIDKPVDRHRWFYSLSEANEFIRHRSSLMGFDICEFNPHVIAKNELSLSKILRSIHRKFWSEEDFVNLYSWVSWWVLCRK